MARRILTTWTVALADAGPPAIVGQGRGFGYSYPQAGPNISTTTDPTKSIGRDHRLWTGLLGLGFVLVAFVTPLVERFSTWRLHPDPAVAVLALAPFAAVIGMIAAGQVESIFENDRPARAPAAMRTYHAISHYEVI